MHRSCRGSLNSAPGLLTTLQPAFRGSYRPSFRAGRQHQPRASRLTGRLRVAGIR